LIEKKDSGEDELPENEAEIMPDASAELKMLQLKVQSMEDAERQQRLLLSGIEDKLVSLDYRNGEVDAKFHDELLKLEKRLTETLVEKENYMNLKAEIVTFREALSNSVQAAFEQREAIEERMRQFQASAAQGNGGNEGELVIGGKEGNFGGEDVSNIKMLINGVDLSAQRQFRKVKRSIRKIERALEEAAEQELRLSAEKGMKEISEGSPVEVVVETPVNGNTVSDVEKVSGDIVEKLDKRMAVKLPTVVEVIQSDFQVFFVLMFSVLLYFLVADVLSA
jgi:hypothetical protein